jgi:diaminohydroxyphosphoribosylaminopyrimidine deaminase/5-amino-6-(5-phosphoribosylamino)uracil reductase
LKRRIILDSLARTPLSAKVVSDEFAALTTIVVSKAAPQKRVAALSKRVNVLVAPIKNSALRTPHSALDLRWLMKHLKVTSILVEGGGEVNAAFLEGGLAQRVAFFYAPKVLGGRDARKGVGGKGIKAGDGSLPLREVEWRRLGPDLLLTGRVDPFPKSK